MQPSNTTVKYGEFVQFKCQVHMDYRRGSLYIYFGNTLLHPLVEGTFSTFDEREFSVGINQCTNCLQNQTVTGYFWILINTKTLQSINMKPFRCRVHYNRTFEDSNRAFIEVIYPECTFSPFQSKALSIIVTSTFQTTNKFLNFQCTIKPTSEKLNVCFNTSIKITNVAPVS